MPIYKVEELEGARLDAAVALAEGHEIKLHSEQRYWQSNEVQFPATLTVWRLGHPEMLRLFPTSSSWAIGGLIK